MSATYYILAFIGSFVTSFLITPLVIRSGFKLGIIDQPHQNTNATRKKTHKNPVPRLGGLVIFFAFILNAWLWLPRFQNPAFLICPSLIFLVGILDDLFSLSAKMRLALEVVISFGFIYSLQAVPEYITLSESLRISIPPFVGYLFGCLILVGAINAMNMVDGLDGLANGIAFISISLLTLVLFLSVDKYGIFFLALPVLGASLGLLKYNGHPARIFLGDGGSYFLGFICGILFLLLVVDQSLVRKDQLLTLYPTNKHVPLPNIILCFAIPIFDTAHVIIKRLLAKQSPIRADNRHFHHTLLRLGLNHSQAVGFTYFLSLVAGTCAVVPLFYTRTSLNYLPLLCVLGLATMIVLPSIYPDNAFTKYANRLMKSRDRQPSTHIAFRYLNRFLETLNINLLYLILLGIPILSGVLPAQVGYYALTAYLLLLSTKIMRGKIHDYIPSAILYLSVAVLLVANNINPLIFKLQNSTYFAQDLYNLLFIVLLASTCIFMLLNIDKRLFLISPSKFLLMAIPLFLLLIPDPLRRDYKLHIIAMRCLIVFFAIQALVQHRPSTFRKLRFACLVSLAFVAFFGIYGITVDLGR